MLIKVEDVRKSLLGQKLYGEEIDHKGRHDRWIGEIVSIEKFSTLRHTWLYNGWFGEGILWEVKIKCKRKELTRNLLNVEIEKLVDPNRHRVSLDSHEFYYNYTLMKTER